MIADLAKAALVGVGKHGRLPEDATPLAELTHPSALTPESALLVRAGLHAVARAVGVFPLANVEQPTLAPEETPRPWTPRLAALFAEALGDRSDGLFEAFAKRLVAHGVTLPPESLPTALTIGSQSRELVQPLLGARGRWLASMNPAWRWAVDGAAPMDFDACKRQFEEGAPPARAAALRALREFDPTAALALLQTTLPQEKADQRALLVANLRTGLSTTDEPLLESLLDDRSEQVRHTAASLLARLPESRLVARMIQRGTAMLAWKSPDKKSVVVSPPAELDGDWQRDGVSKTPPHGVGKRAFWTEATVAAVPLAHWTSALASEPHTLVAAAAKDEFGEHVVAGWTEAFTRNVKPADDGWFDALWRHWETLAQSQTKNADQGVVYCERLLLGAQAAQGEAKLAPLLDRSQFRAERWAGLVARLPAPWSEDFGKRYWASLRPAVLCADERSFDWASTMRHAALAMPETSLGDFAMPWNVAINEKLGWRRSAIEKMIAEACEIAGRRREFETELRKTLAS